MVFNHTCYILDKGPDEKFMIQFSTLRKAIAELA